MLKKLIVLAGLASGVAALAKKRRDARTEADLWHEATTAAPTCAERSSDRFGDVAQSGRAPPLQGGG